MLTIFFTGLILKNHIKVIKIKYLNIKYRITMSHFLFCIKEYTNKQGSNWLSFGDLFVVLFGDLFVVLFTQIIMTFNATYRRLFGVEINDVFWRLLSSSKHNLYNNVYCNVIVRCGLSSLYTFTANVLIRRSSCATRRLTYFYSTHK